MAPNPDIGRYRLDRQLTPDGNVWMAEDLEDPGTSVVVKFLGAGADVLGFRQQGHTLGELDQPGLVAPLDSGEAPDGRPFFVFPYVDGRTLRQVLNEDGPMSFRRTGVILRQVGRILAAAHSKHIVHGGLDPEHVMISTAHGREVVNVINFGGWRVSPRVSTPPGYLAPEQRAGNITASGDIFGLAALAAEMITGRRAFRYGSESDLERQQRIGLARGGLRQLRKGIPSRAEDEIRRGLSYDAAHRPGDAAVFAGRIADALAETESMPLRRVLLFGGLFAAVAAASSYRACRRHR